MKAPQSFLALVGLVAFALPGAQAQATRTWISGVGDDANPCSRTAPCKTFAGAISKTAASGEIDALDPGGFGALTITKSITLDGGGGQVASVLTSGTNGITIAGTGSVVTIRNLRIEGLGTSLGGIKLITGNELHIEHCFIHAFTNGIDIEPGANANVFIDNTSSTDNSQNGLYVEPSSGATEVTVSNSYFNDNTQNGVLAGDGAKVTVSNTSANGNGAAGFLSTAATADSSINLVNSVAAYNVGAAVSAVGSSTPFATVRVGASSLFGDGSAFSTTGANGGIISYGNNMVSGAGTPTSTTGLK